MHARKHHARMHPHTHARTHAPCTHGGGAGRLLRVFHLTHGVGGFAAAAASAGGFVSVGGADSSSAARQVYATAAAGPSYDDMAAVPWGAVKADVITAAPTCRGFDAGRSDAELAAAMELYLEHVTAAVAGAAGGGDRIVVEGFHGGCTRASPGMLRATTTAGWNRSGFRSRQQDRDDGSGGGAGGHTAPSP